MHTLRSRSALILFVPALILPSSLAQSGAGANGETTLVSRTSTGQAASAQSRRPSISRDGRYVAFDSDAGLQPLDLNGHGDVYVLDRQTGTLVVASRTQVGLLGNAGSFDARISGDGRHVVFTTHATFLDPQDANGTTDVMLKNLDTGALTRVSNAAGSNLAANGASSNATVSFDGRYVAFQSSASDLHPLGANGLNDVYVKDMVTGTITCASRGMFGAANGFSGAPSISDDGALVAFHSAASNLTLHDLNGVQDVFVRNMIGGGIARITNGVGGAAPNGNSFEASLSADGRYVAFLSSASNLVAFDTNGVQDVFVHDRQTGATQLVSGSAMGGVSAGSASLPAISGDGRSVAFVSSATDLVANPPAFGAVYVRSLDRGVTYLASRATGVASLPNGWSSRPALAHSGGIVVFDSNASNLDADDTNAVVDVFVRETQPNPVLYCTPSITSAGCLPSVSASGWPRASQSSGFVVSCNDAPNQKAGLMFFSLGGRLSVPFGAGTFCVATPVTRTPMSFSGGHPATVSDCTGQFQIDMNSYAKGLLGVSAPSALSQVGQRVNVQFWGRDPQGAVATTFLSDALEYHVGP